MFRCFILFLNFVTFVNCQYDNAQNKLSYNHPGHVPPMSQEGPPGYVPSITLQTTSTLSSNGLRAPPVPTWIQNRQSESSGKQLKIENVINGKNKDSIGNEPGSGEGSGRDEILHSGFDEGSAVEIEASGAVEDSLPEIMKSIDGEAAVLGVNCPTDVMFIVDATASVKGIYEQYINFLEKVIEGLDIQPNVDRVGAIVYSSEKKQRLTIKLGQHKDMGALVKAVDELPFFSGITATGQALKFAASHTEGRRENLTLNYVILTDGYSYDIIESGARILRGVPNSAIYAVSIGEIYLKNELEIITGNPENVLIGSMSYGTLVKRLKLCDAKIRAETKQSHNLNLDYRGEILSNDFKINNRSVHKEKKENEFFNQKPEKQLAVTDCLYDVGIIFDSSGSLENNFQRQLSFAKQLVNQMPVSENATRVAIIKFAGKDKIRVLADFKENKTLNDLRKIIELCTFYSGTTFTNQALMKMAKLFKDSKRPDAKLKLIVFTDGYSAEDTSEGIEDLKSQGVVVYTFGISTDKSAGLNMNELREMATSPKHYYDSYNFSELSKHFPSSEYC